LKLAASPLVAGRSGAGGGAQTSEVVAGFDELTLINPKNVIIMIGGNDIDFGVPSATYEANLDSIRTHFQGLGSNIIWCYNTPRNVTDITAVNTYIGANYSADTIIEETFTDFDDGGTGMMSSFNSDDGVHPGGWGHFMIHRVIGGELNFGIDSLTETAFTGGVKVTITGNSMIKTTTSAWDGSAIGTVALDYTNSKIYFGAEGVGAAYPGVGVGFSVSDTGSSFTDIEQGIIVLTTQALRPMLNGVIQAAISPVWNFGDLLTVEIDGSNLIICQNQVEIYNQAATMSANMKVKTTLFTIGDEIIGVLNT